MSIQAKTRAEKLEPQIFEEVSKTLNDADARYLAKRLSGMSRRDLFQTFQAADVARAQ